MPIILAAASIILAYLLGSIPSGVLAARLVTGVEVRRVGSGRTGATNAYRAAGPWGLALTCLGDVLKGVFAVWVARVLMVYALSLGVNPSLAPWIEAAAGIAVVAGHNWSAFLGFRGGAGTATSIGVLGAMNLYVGLGLTVIGLLVMIITRMASPGSITIALAMAPALAISAAAGGTPWACVMFGIVGGAFTIHALIPNVRRILRGQERRLKTLD